MIYKFSINFNVLEPLVSVTVLDAKDIFEALRVAESVFPNDHIRIYSITKP